VSPPAGRAADRRSRARNRRARRLAGWALRGAVVALAFAVGVAVGRALDDNPDPRERRTYVRTLQPRPVAPAPPTVTVTVTTSPTAGG
jgi:hypothetical protein